MPVSLAHPDRFQLRHIGPDDRDVAGMLQVIGVPTLDELIEQTIPSSIRLRRPLDLPAARSEHELLELAHSIAQKNETWRSLLGMGYSDCITPPVILRNVVENPAWYTQYTPYQAEVSQGRLEALLNFQTMVSDLTALEIANASLLDEGTAAAEAMHVMEAYEGRRRSPRPARPRPVPPADHRGRAHARFGAPHRGRRRPTRRRSTSPRRSSAPSCSTPRPTGAWTTGVGFIERAHAEGAMVTMACDLLALALVTPPGEMGADIAVGSAQRFGVPLGYGGPHAAFFACKTEHVRKLPGRIIGVSVDAHGRPALRMALQTREQHIRREKATSNVCTAQALLANVASMYAVYHGPAGIKAIAERGARARGRPRARPGQARGAASSTIGSSTRCASRASRRRSTPGWLAPARASSTCAASTTKSVGLALDETTSAAEVDSLLAIFQPGKTAAPACVDLAREAERRPRATWSARAVTSPTRSSTRTTPRPRCSATSARWRRRTSRWCTR